MEKEQKKFIVNIIIFCLILIELIIIINSVYIQFVFNKKMLYRQEVEYDEFVKNSNKTLEFAFLGDSHTANAINPEYIPRSWSFAFLSDGNYLANYYRLKKVVEYDNISIKYVIFEIDMHSFSEAMFAGDFFSTLNLRSKYLSLSEIGKIRNDCSFAKILFEIYLPVLGQGSEFKYLYLKELSNLYRGHNTADGDLTKQPDIDFELANQYRIHFKNFKRIDNKSMGYFLKSIKFAKEHNISIIFMKYPIAKELNEYYENMNVTREDYYSEILKEINLTIGDNYTLLDYHDYLNDTSYFYDPGHLNVKGSEIFSKKVYLELIELEKCKTHPCD